VISLALAAILALLFGQSSFDIPRELCAAALATWTCHAGVATFLRLGRQVDLPRLAWAKLEIDLQGFWPFF
jgi:hypothetical protein